MFREIYVINGPFYLSDQRWKEEPYVIGSKKDEGFSFSIILLLVRRMFSFAGAIPFLYLLLIYAPVCRKHY
jgi:hypothetical protein